MLLKISFSEKQSTTIQLLLLGKYYICRYPIKQKRLVRESDPNALPANIFDHNHSRIHNHPPVASHTRAEKTKRRWTTQNN